MSTLAVNVLENLSGDAIGTITLGTEQASTSGTSIDFTSIPSGVQRITIMYEGCSHDNTSTNVSIQIGDSGGLETTGYLGAGGHIYNTGQAAGSYATRFPVLYSAGSAAVFHGSTILTLKDATNNTWVAQSTVGTDSGYIHVGGGSKSLSAELDRISILTTAGSFDAGSINIQYEI